jgi:hypothetical protein
MTPEIKMINEIITENTIGVTRFGSFQKPARYIEIIPVIGFRYAIVWNLSGMSETP